jgi:hypothetical protein
MVMATFAQAARNPELSLADLSALALVYNLQVELEVGTRQMRVVHEMCRVNHIALGCSVIRRDAFESLIVAGIAQLRPDWFLQKSGFAGPSTISLARSEWMTAMSSRKTTLSPNAGVVFLPTRSGLLWTSQSGMGRYGLRCAIFETSPPRQSLMEPGGPDHELSGCSQPSAARANLFARMQSPLNEVLLWSGSAILAQPGRLR